MGAFNINITGVGGHGCERKAKAGDKLYGRCGRFTCPDCAAYDFVQRLKQAGMLREGDVAYSVECKPTERETIIGQNIDKAISFAEADGKIYAQFPHEAKFTHWPDS